MHETLIVTPADRTGLDPAVARKITDLADAHERTRADFAWLRDRHHDATRAVHDLERNLRLDFEEPNRSRVPEDRRPVPPERQEELARAQAERDRRAADLAAVEPRRGLGSLVHAIDQALKRGELAGVRAAVVAPPDGTPSTWLAALDTVRASLEPLRAEIAATLDAPVTLGEAEARLTAFCDTMTATVDLDPFVALFTPPDPPAARTAADRARDPWQPPAAYQLLGGGAAARHDAVLSLLLRGTDLRAKLLAALRATYKRGGWSTSRTYTAAERDARVAELREQLRTAERHEETLVLALERARVDCPRRADACPIAVATTVLDAEPAARVA